MVDSHKLHNLKSLLFSSSLKKWFDVNSGLPFFFFFFTSEEDCFHFLDPSANFFGRSIFNEIWRRVSSLDKLVATTDLIFFSSQTPAAFFFFWLFSWAFSTDPSHITPQSLYILCVLHLTDLRAYLSALPANPPECSHRVWSRNGWEGCADLLHDIITQMVYCTSTGYGFCLKPWRPRVDWVLWWCVTDTLDW